MTILYKNKSAKEQFCSEYKKKWRYPDQVKKRRMEYKTWEYGISCNDDSM